MSYIIKLRSWLLEETSTDSTLNNIQYTNPSITNRVIGNFIKKKKKKKEEGKIEY